MLTYRYQLEFQAPDDATASRLVSALNQLLLATSPTEAQLPLGLEAIGTDMPFAARKPVRRRRKPKA